MAKAKAGKPSLYREKYCDLLIEHFKKGKSYVAFASLLGVHKDTLYEWEKVHKEYSDAKKIGWQHYQTWWEEQGQEGLYDQTFSEPDGSRRTVKLNATVWIYNMKCRFRDDWFDAKDLKKEPPKSNESDEQEVKRLVEWYRNLKEMK